MPRIRKDQATTHSQAIHIARWRYLLRNPVFQKDMDSLYDALGGKQFYQEAARIADKWGLLRIPGEAIVYWPGGRPKSEDFAALEKYGSEDLVSYSPVTVTELRENRFLFFRVDLSLPVDVILPLIEEELRVQLKFGRRHRQDKIDFHLRVFDLAVEGLSFSDIAKEVHSNISTVKHTYFTAKKKIFSDTDGPQKRQLPLEYFDAECHLQSCTICKNAKEIDQMCPEGQRYCNQDYTSQRELTGHNERR